MCQKSLHSVVISKSVRQPRLLLRGPFRAFYSDTIATSAAAGGVISDAEMLYRLTDVAVKASVAPACENQYHTQIMIDTLDSGAGR